MTNNIDSYIGANRDDVVSKADYEALLARVVSLESQNNTNGTNLEVGNNENGTYYKFSDGTMICTKKVSVSNIKINEAASNIYRSAQFSLGDFAYNFIELPTVTGSVINSAIACWISSINDVTSTSCGKTRLMLHTTNSSVSATINLTAIGKWK